MQLIKFLAYLIAAIFSAYLVLAFILTILKVIPYDGNILIVYFGVGYFSLCMISLLRQAYFYKNDKVL